MATTGSEIASAYVSITTKMPGVQKDIRKQLGGVDTTAAGSQMGSKLADGMKKTLKVAGAGIAGVLGTALVKGFGRLKAIETAQAKMRGLGYDSKTVAKAMDNALKSVQGTAFGLGDAATVAGGAMAAQIKPGKELEKHLTRIANNAAAAGVGFDEMGALFNKAATQANGVQNDVIGMLADKGIPIYAELGKQMGVTAGEVFKLASEGKVSFEVFSKAAEAAAGTVAEEMGKTTTGSFDNMMAALGRLGAKMLEDVFPLIGPTFQNITTWLDNAGQKIEELINGFVKFKDDAIAALTPALEVVGKNLDAAFGPAKPLLEGIKTAADSALSGIGPMVADLAEKFPDMLVKASAGVRDFSNWLQENRTQLTVVFGVINALLLPIYVRLGVKAIASAAKQVVAWAMSSGGAVRAGATYVIESYKIIGRWVAMGLAAVKSGAETVAIWAMLKWDAIKSAAVYAVQSGRVAAAWALQSASAVASWAVQGVVFIAQKGALVAQAAATGIATGAQKLFNLALKANPIGIVITAITALVGALVWFFTKTKLGQQIWANFSKFFIEAWANIKAAFSLATTWIVNTATSWGSNIAAWWNGLWSGIGRFFSDVWAGVKLSFQTMMNWFKTKPVQAFEAARDAIGKAWRGVQELAAKPVRFVVETVFGGLVDAVNGFLPKGMKLPRPALPKGFREGGFTPNVGLNTVAGVVHGREFVTRAESTARIERNHPGLLDHMNRTGTVPGYRKGGLVHPLPGSVITTQWMGYPGHTGMDFAKPQGTPIQAAAAGVVSRQQYHVNYGNMVDLNHGAGFSTRYAHMLANVAVKLGQSVKAGQVVGYEGSTGNSTGPHLHFETLQNGNPVNPAPFLSGAASVKPAFGIVEGLLDGAISKFKGAFPGGGFFVDAAGSVMKSAVKGAVDWIGEKLSFGVGGGTKLYDQGGIIPHGGTGINLSGKPEAVLTNEEARGYKAMMRALSGSGGLEGVGGNVLAGLVAGLRGGRSGVEGAVREVTSAIIGTANKELDIHSPSRVFRTIGGYIGAGLNAGITGSVAATRTATERLVRSVVSGFDQLGGERSSLQKKLDKALGNWRGAKAGSKAKAQYAAQIADYRKQIAAINTTIGAPGRSKEPALLKSLATQNAKLNTLAFMRAQVAKKLTAAQKSLAEASDQMSDWSAGIQDKINSLGGITSKSTVPGMVANLTKRIEQTKNFTRTITKLKGLGLDSGSLQELTEQFASTGSSKAADALLASGKAGVKQVVDLRKQLDAAGGKLGDQIGVVLYQAGVDSAKGLIKGLQSQEKALQAQAKKIADTITQTVKRTLKIKSPSRVMDGLGQWTGIGFANGLDATQPLVASAAESLFRVPDSFGDSLQAAEHRAKVRPLDVSSGAGGQGGGVRAGERLYIVLDDGTELGGYVDRRADSVVRREVGSQSRGAFRRDGGF